MRNRVISLLFVSIIVSVFIVNITSSEVDVSYSERREMKKISDLDFTDIIEGDFTQKFDKVALDQIYLREGFRKIKAFVAYNVFRKNDNNDIFIVGEHIFKRDYPYVKKDLVYFGDYLEKIRKLYLVDSDIYMSIVPAKNYYLKEEDRILTEDFKILEKEVTERVPWANYVNITTELSLDSYYRTDPHWKQNDLFGVVDTLLKSMNKSYILSTKDYKVKKNYPFYGAYFGQSAIHFRPDTLEYFVSPVLDKVLVRDYDGGVVRESIGVNNLEGLDGMDSYDLYSYGPTPMIRFLNEEAASDKRLLIFRDSFGSSIGPLFVESYKEVVLIDTRYVSYKMLREYVDFEDSDVLFLYSSLLIKNSGVLK